MIVRVMDYVVIDGVGTQVHCQSDAPAPYAQSDFYVVLIDSELPDNISTPTLRTLIANKLARKYGGTYNPSTVQGSGVAPLNSIIGTANGTFTVAATT